MKTITRKNTNISLYLFTDDTVVDMGPSDTTVGDPIQFIIADCSTENANLYAEVTDPGDWQGWKYLYTPDIGWALNPDWTPPV